MSMNHEQNDKRKSVDHSANATGGEERSGDGGETGSEPQNNPVLDTATERRGVSDTTPKTSGTQAARPNLAWQFHEVWNESIGTKADRPLEQRDYLWASELGAAPIDVWLKMRATPYTNPPNERSKRKFAAGYLYEWIVKMILKRAGILLDEEKRCEYQYDGLLKVTGRLDKLAGGKPDYDAAKAELEALELPEGFLNAGEAIVSYLNKNYPEGLGEKPIEIKSVSSFAMDAMERHETPMKHHKLQLFHYLKSLGYSHGLLVYVCRDDCRMNSFTVLNPSSVEDDYQAAIKEHTNYFHGDTEPPKEKLLVFDEDFKKFSKNLRVEYSPYLTKLYGYETPREYSEQYAKVATSWNRVLGRMAEGKELTKNNQEKLQEIEEAGFDVEALKTQFTPEPETDEATE